MQFQCPECEEVTYLRTDGRNLQHGSRLMCGACENQYHIQLKEMNT